LKIWTPTAPILNRPLHVSVIYNYFYSWMCLQNLHLLNIMRSWRGWEWELCMSFRFTPISEHKRHYCGTLFIKK
jgi:hypothetical protein